MLGINNEKIIDNEYSNVGNNTNDISVNDTTNSTNDDILDVMIRFNINIDDADDSAPVYNNEVNVETPIHLNISH